MKSILFHNWVNENWMGGVYYIRNMIFALLQNKEAMEELHIYILSNSTTANVFEDLKNNEKVTLILSDKLTYSQRLLKKIKKIWYADVLKKNVHRDLLLTVNKYKIDYIYPMCYKEDVYANKGISWIPDLQHIYYPEYFPGDSLNERKEQYEYFAKNHRKMVLSSNSVKEDYFKTYPGYTNNIYIIPFVSAIEMRIVQENKTEQTKKKYDITGKYFFVANQFWKHKNHRIVFEALAYAKKNKNIEITVVCTGRLEDYRNETYVEELRKYIQQNHLEENIKILGFIDREEQLQLMKGALAVIQPSLFEGWGTVVEDAKTLHKKIIMSDIAVHEEQKNADCTIFEKNNEKQLAKIMINFWKMGFAQSVDSDYNYKKQAAEYGKMFYDMLNDEIR